jgi:hypothetical protein
VALPAAPEELLNAYVQWAPWVYIIFGALGVVGLLMLTLISAAASPLLLLGGAGGVAFGGALFMTLLTGIVLAALEVIGGWLMYKRRLTGWWVVAVGLVLNALYGLLGGGLLRLILALAFAYVHLQVKPRYN